MIVRDHAIKKICWRLTASHGVSLGKMTALDFFAREGDWQTQYIAERVNKMYAWEVNEEFEPNLRLNLPDNSVIQMGDSHILALKLDTPRIFDMVIYDNPQGCYGKDNEYCEHFDALPLLPLLLKEEGGVVILNVKAQPFNYEDKLDWQCRRNTFYAIDDTSNVPLDFLQHHYQAYFESLGYGTEFSFMIVRPQETGLYSLVSKLIRI